jgi:hypothetical protein
MRGIQMLHQHESHPRIGWHMLQEQREGLETTG